MTDNTQPLALRLAEQYDYGDPVAHSNTWKVAVCNELRRQHARIAELESQLESIGAGGVSGPMMGQPQAMPDLSALTERGAKAWAGVDAQGLREGFTAADMATASAQGFRDGVASVAASAGSEPVATVFTMEALAPGGGVKYHATVHKPLPAGTKLYLHPSPPEGIVGGWRPIEAAPKDGTRFVAVGQNYGLYSETQHICIAQWFRGCWIEVSDWNGASKLKYLTHWMPLPPLPPTAQAADSMTAPATDSYVQPVPDKCDRIVWRGHYYHLPPTAQAADSVTAPAGEVVGYRISDPGEPDLGHWLSEEPGAAWCVSEPLALATHTQPAHATKAGNQQEARPCHVFTVRKAGGLTEWEPTSMAFALPDGAHALYTLPQPTQAQAVAVPLTAAQKQQIHNETGAGHALICIVESYLLEAHNIKGGQHGAE